MVVAVEAGASLSAMLNNIYNKYIVSLFRDIHRGFWIDFGLPLALVVLFWAVLTSSFRCRLVGTWDDGLLVDMDCTTHTHWKTAPHFAASLPPGFRPRDLSLESYNSWSYHYNWNYSSHFLID